MVDMTSHTNKFSERQPTTFSPELAIDIRHKGAKLLTRWLAETTALAEALEQLDAALQIFAQDRGIDEMQAVINAARHLSTLLEGDQPAQVESGDNVDFCEVARRERGMMSMPEWPTLPQMMGGVSHA